MYPFDGFTRSRSIKYSRFFAMDSCKCINIEMIVTRTSRMNQGKTIEWVSFCSSFYSQSMLVFSFLVSILFVIIRFIILIHGNLVRISKPISFQIHYKSNRNSLFSLSIWKTKFNLVWAAFYFSLKIWKKGHINENANFLAQQTIKNLNFSNQLESTHSIAECLN